MKNTKIYRRTVPDRGGLPCPGRQHGLHPPDGANAGRHHRHGPGRSPEHHFGQHHRLCLGELWSVQHRHQNAGGVRSPGFRQGRAGGRQRPAGAEAHRRGRTGVHRERGQPRDRPDPAAAAGHLRRKDHQLEGRGRPGSGHRGLPAPV